MQGDREQLRNEILEEALNLSSGDRRTFVHRVCAADHEMIGEVMRLISSYDSMQSGFLECPPISVAIEPLESGSILDRYRIESVIGRGGMSIVYRARDTVTESSVALKFITTTYPDSGELRRRFLRELQNLLKLQHESIVRVYDSGEHEGQPFLVMELLNGEDLAAAIESGRCGGVAGKLAIAKNIAGALAHVNRMGILHRDVKPSNIFLLQSGLVKLMDFGVSRLLEPGVSHASTFAGTLQYMAPELISGAPATRAADIYSYGVLLYELFTGKTRAAHTSMAAMFGDGPETPLSLEALEHGGLPPALSQIIMKATSREPAARQSGFAQIELALDSISVS